MVKYSPAIFIIQYYSGLSNHSSIFKSINPSNNDTHIMAKNCWVFGDLINLQKS